jgi:17beta-estradiol 17-dehydrogenase / very-long-chain 3-oxoacyl-CoA reductase
MAIDDILAAIPKPVTVGFAALGALWLGRKVVSYIALLLDLFILSGTNVRITPQKNCSLEYNKL